MKTFLPLFICLTSLSLCQAQTNVYHQFLHEGGQWNTLKVRWCCPPFDTGLEGEPDSTITLSNFRSVGDTIIDGREYIKIESYISYFHFIREDTIERRIYQYEEGIDILLFDYNLEVGDTINHLADFSEMPLGAIVYEIDSVLIEDNFRKRWIIKYPSNIYATTTELGTDDTVWVYSYWIEGIGGRWKLFWEPGVSGLTPYDREQLLCYSEDSVILFQDLTDYVTCDSVLIVLDIKNNVENGDAISIYPNPTSNNIYIEITNALPGSNYGFDFYDITGKLLFQKELSTADINIFELGALSSGIYLIRVNENGILRSTEKIIKE